jgi:hypothetical protein
VHEKINILSDTEYDVNPSEIINILSDEEYEKLNRKAKRLGCEPEYNAYTQKIDPKPLETKIRSVGGHMHFGNIPETQRSYITARINSAGIYYLATLKLTTNEEYVLLAKKQEKIQERLYKYIKLMDAFVSIPMLCIQTNDLAKQERVRRTIYGKAGACRFPVHGLEYRTPSTWYSQSIALVSLFYGLARGCFYLRSKRIIEEIKSIEFDVVRAINDGDRELAKQLWYGIIMPAIEKTTIFYTQVSGDDDVSDNEDYFINFINELIKLADEGYDVAKILFSLDKKLYPNGLISFLWKINEYYETKKFNSAEKVLIDQVSYLGDDIDEEDDE